MKMKIKVKFGIEDLVCIDSGYGPHESIGGIAQITGFDWKYFSSAVGEEPELTITYSGKYDWDGVFGQVPEKFVKKLKGNGLKNEQIFETSSLFGNSFSIGSDIIVVPSITIAPKVYEVRGLGYRSWLDIKSNKILEEKVLLVKDKLHNKLTNIGEMIFNKDYIISDITEEWLMETLGRMGEFSEAYERFFKYFDLLDEAKYLHKTIKK